MQFLDPVLEISAKRSTIIETFEYSGEYELVKDTFLNTVENGNMILPKFTSLGVTYRGAYNKISSLT